MLLPKLTFFTSRFMHILFFLLVTLLVSLVITSHTFADTILDKPELTTPRALTTHAPVISWQNVNGAMRYEISRNGTMIQSTTTTTFTDIDAAGPGKQETKTYRVQAFDENNNDSPMSDPLEIKYYWAEPQFLLSPIPNNPSSPLNLSAIIITPTGWDLTKVLYTLDENLVILPETNGTEIPFLPTSDDRVYTAATSVNIFALAKGNHYFDMKTFLTANENCIPQPPDGAWFNPCQPGNTLDMAISPTFTIGFTVPTGLFGQSPTEEKPHLTWNAVENATGYNVYRDDVLIGNTTVPEFTDQALTTAGDYLYSVTAIGPDDDESGKSTPAFITYAPQRVLEALEPLEVWLSKPLLDIGLRVDVKAEVYKDDTIVSTGQINSVTIGTGLFPAASEHTIPFSSFTPTAFPEGSQLKVVVSARNACSGSLRNNGTARLWFNDSQADSHFEATIQDNTNDYFLRDDFILANTTGAERQLLTTNVGEKCTPFKSFGTWTITP